MSEKAYTLGEVAEKFGVQLWHVQRLFDRKKRPIPPVHKIGTIRFVYESELPIIEQQLQEDGRLELTAKGRR